MGRMDLKKPPDVLPAAPFQPSRAAAQYRPGRARDVTHHMYARTHQPVWVLPRRRSRWCRCLDHILVFREHHLKRILREYVGHYNTERPHLGLSLENLEPQQSLNLTEGEVVRVAKLGGLINEYHRIAA